MCDRNNELESSSLSQFSPKAVTKSRCSQRFSPVTKSDWRKPTQSVFPNIPSLAVWSHFILEMHQFHQVEKPLTWFFTTSIFLGSSFLPALFYNQIRGLIKSETFEVAIHLPAPQINDQRHQSGGYRKIDRLTTGTRYCSPNDLQAGLCELCNSVSYYLLYNRFWN